MRAVEPSPSRLRHVQELACHQEPLRAGARALRHALAQSGARGLVRGIVSLTILPSDSGGSTTANVRGNWRVAGPEELYDVNSRRVFEVEFQQGILQAPGSNGREPARDLSRIAGTECSGYGTPG
jgi:hypothetical protein